jgi:hypothetical protein
MCLTRLVSADHSHIVFVRTSGQVYSMEAVEQMNIKIKSWNVCSLAFHPFLARIVSRVLTYFWSVGSDHGRSVHSQRRHQVSCPFDTLLTPAVLLL